MQMRWLSSVLGYVNQTRFLKLGLSPRTKLFARKTRP